MAAGKAGADLGFAVLWAAALGAVLKFSLAEGVARWQLATGTTMLEGWVAHFGRVVQALFLVYFLLWSVIVAAALLSACGLAAWALAPFLGVKTWALVHAAAAVAFVFGRGYGPFETVMKIAVGLMFVAILGSALLLRPEPGPVLRGLVVPSVPEGSLLRILGVMGGVGGSLTLLSYNYWMREKGWLGDGFAGLVRLDLGVGYALTGLFGVAMVFTAAAVLHPMGVTLSGTQGILELASVLGERWGRAGELVFLVGFWGAVATSTLGVWQGVPYLFADFTGLVRGWAPERLAAVSTREPVYRGYVVFMTLAPVPLLFLDRPVWLVVVYAAVGALFMPFLAATLLVLNNRRSLVGGLRNGPLANGTLVLSLAVFLYLGITTLRDRFGF